MTLSFSAELSPAELHSLIRRASSVQAKTTIPILDYALLKGNGQLLSVASTNLDQAVTSAIPCGAVGSCTANISRLSSIAGALEKGVPVQLTVNGTGELTVKQGRSRYSMPTLPVEDYPALGEARGAQMSVPADELARSLRDLEGCVSHAKDGRYYLQGVFFDTRDGSLVATDSKALGRDPAEWCNANRDGFIVPSSAIRPVCDLAALTELDVKITAGETSATFSAKNVSVWTKYVDGQFPDWQRVVPRDWPSVWRMKRADIAVAIKRIAAIDRGGDYGTAIKCDFGATEATLTAKAESGSAECSFPCERVNGTDLTIGLGAKLVAWAVGALDGEDEIVLSAIDAGAPVRFTPAGSQDSLRIVMPQRIG